MTVRSKVAVTAILLLGIAGLAGVDAYMNQRELTAYVPYLADDQASSKPAEMPKGVAKATGPDTGAVAAEMGFAIQEGNEASLIGQVVAGSSPVRSLILLKDGDRAGAVIWIDSPNVKTYFLALKESLLSSFSSNVRDLRDVTQNEEGKPVRNILTFIDPSLSDERLAFVRVRERLYEFHINASQEAAMTMFIDTLTSR